jgi:hypothetical protein
MRLENFKNSSAAVRALDDLFGLLNKRKSNEKYQKGQ